MTIKKTGAAFGLAALTLASSLSLGAQAHAAPAPSPAKDAKASASTQSVPADGTQFQMVTQDANGRWYGESSKNNFPNFKQFATKAEAEATSSVWTVKTQGNYFALVPTFSANVCAASGLNALTWLSAPCTTRDDALFSLDSSGRMVSKDKGTYVSAPIPDERNPAVFHYGMSKTAPAVHFDKINPEAPATSPLSASARADASGVVWFEGKATPGAELRLDGVKAKTVGADGNWSFGLWDEPAGPHTYTVSQYVNGKFVDQKTVPVTIPVGELSAPTDLRAYKSSGNPVTNRISIDGAAVSGATVKISDRNGKLTTVTANASGYFDTYVDAPAGGSGLQEFTVWQEKDGKTSPTVKTQFNYGSDVTITSPSAGASFENGAFKVAGGTQATAILTLKEGSRTIDTKTATSGTYSFDLSGVTPGTHTYTVSQQSIGNRVTTASVTVTVKQANLAAPTDVRAYKSSGNPVTTRISIDGKATPGATVKITDRNSKLTTVTANATTGYFDTYIDAPAGGSGLQEFTVWQEKDGKTSPTVKTDFQFGSNVTITSPSSGASLDNGTFSIAGGTQATSNLTLKEGSTVLDTKTATSGTYSFDLRNVAPGTHTFTVSQQSIGNRISTSSVTVTVKQAKLDAVTSLRSDESTVDPIRRDMAISGYAAPGATVNIRDRNNVITTRPANETTGFFNISVPAPVGGSGVQTFTVWQVKGGATSPTAQVNFTYGALVGITAPSNGSQLDTGDFAITGSTQARAILTLKEGATTLATKTATNSAYSFDLTGVTPGRHTYTVQQQSVGNLVSTKTVTVDVEEAVATPLTLTNLADGDAFHVGGTTHLEGTAAAGATITVKQGTTELGQATADASGRWSFDATIAGTVDTTLNLTQSGSSKVTSVGLKAPAFTPLTVTSGHTFPGSPVTTITGKATPYATIQVSIFGVPTTVTADKNGDWSYSRGFNNTMTYKIDFTQTALGQSDSVLAWEIGPSITTEPITFTNIKDGDSFNVGGVTRLEGTATKNSQVTIKQGNVELGTANTDGAGKWSFDAKIGGTANTALNVTQKGSSAVTTLNLVAPAFRPLAITSGHAFPGTPVTTIKGTATPFATIEVSVFGIPTTVTADKDGNWSYSRGFNNAMTYKIDFAQKAHNGADSIAGWEIGPNVAPVKIDNASGSAFNVGGKTILSGTAEKNADVTIKQGATVLGTTKADANGKWKFEATITGTANAVINATQAGSDAVTSVTLVAPAFRALSVTSGHAFPGTPVTTITGTATPFATITVTVFGVPATVTADADGNWSYKRGFNNALSYKIDFAQTAHNGSDAISAWEIGPAA